MASFIYNTAKKEIMDNTIDLDTDTLKVMLVTSSYVANADDDVVDASGANDPVDHELTGTGYIAGWGNSGRKALTSVTATADKTNDRAELDAADLTWSGINAGTAAAAIIIKEGGANDTTSRLIAYIDSGGFPITTNGGDLTVTWNAEGIIHLT
ncbi:MAG: hypothetical protein ACE5IR_27135 [bacterium]